MVEKRGIVFWWQYAEVARKTLINPREYRKTKKVIIFKTVVQSASLIRHFHVPGNRNVKIQESLQFFRVLTISPTLDNERSLIAVYILYKNDLSSRFLQPRHLHMSEQAILAS